MFYIIDFDTLQPESKSTDEEVLAAYIIDNDLTLAVAMVSTEEQLCLEFTIKEMQELSDNLGGDVTYQTKEGSAEWCLRLLEGKQGDIPDFSSRLGKRLIKEADKRTATGSKPAKDTNATSPEPKPTRKRSGASGKRPTDDTVLTVGTKPGESTMLFKVWSVVEDNLGDMPLGEIVKACSLEETQCRKQISRCIRKGVLTIEEEL